MTDFIGFSTDPADPAARHVLEVLRARTGAEPSIGGAPYFTDASALVPGLGNVPTVVIGPGDAAQCHKKDEYCLVPNIRDACEIYSALIERMCLLA